MVGLSSKFWERESYEEECEVVGVVTVLLAPAVVEGGGELLARPGPEAGASVADWPCRGTSCDMMRLANRPKPQVLRCVRSKVVGCGCKRSCRCSVVAVINKRLSFLGWWHSSGLGLRHVTLSIDA